ncbi:MAG: T9SS type A sorting domain-containing protein [Bacteroidia bacterium]
MKKITTTLLFFLSINLTQAQDIKVSSGTAFQIPSGVIFHLNGLTLTPSATFDLDGLSLTKNAARTQSLPSGNTNASITRAYTFSATSPSFSGTVRVDYVDGELNGITESTLEVNDHNGTAWNQVSTASRDVNADYVISGALTTQTLREITMASSSAALPVTWLDFTAASQDKVVLLNWSTAQELNSLDFVVQHSTDGKVFTNLTSQPAAGNSSSIQNYYYVHTSPVLGYNYYRIHQRDFDGESSNSEIRVVKFSNATIYNDIRVIENPLQTNELKLYTNLDQEITIYTMVGQLSLQQHIQAGINTINVSSLPKGTYLLQTATSSQKIIKL